MYKGNGKQLYTAAFSSCWQHNGKSNLLWRFIPGDDADDDEYDDDENSDDDNDDENDNDEVLSIFQWWTLS